RKNLGIYPQLAHFTRDQVAVLAAGIKDGNLGIRNVVGHLREKAAQMTNMVWCSSGLISVVPSERSSSWPCPEATWPWSTIRCPSTRRDRIRHSTCGRLPR